MHSQENTLFTFDRDKTMHYLTLTLGTRSYKMMPSGHYIMAPMQLQSLELLSPSV